tara:strand:+ start:17939 stop:18145 length:207 start_codon:yes stop_codon:yes gene_type:complete
MPNMSYCRFENTSKDMRDCLYALDRGEAEDLSNYEIEGLKNLLAYAKEIVELEGEIEGLVEQNEATLP